MKKALFLTLILSGCMVGPTYHEPQPQLPQTWESPEHTERQEVATSEPLSRWWEQFHDPLLNRYASLAETCNNSLAAAQENICQARGIRQIAASRLYPHLNLDLNAERRRNSIGMSSPLPVPKFQSIFTTLLDVSWEIDLFGKNQRLTQAADANIERQIDAKNDLLITILADVATTYFDIRGSQQLASLTQEKIALQEATLAIDTKRFEAGYIDAATLAQTEATLATLRAELPDIQGNIYSGIYALSVLTGNFPGALMEELLTPAPLPAAPDIVAIGLQSDLLCRRPDIRAKERELAAYTALTGYAVASFYPTFSLTANGGVQASQIRDLFEKSSKTWSLGGDILMPIFQGGRLIGQLRAAEASTASACYNYQQTVLNALKEVESSLSLYLENRSKGDLLTQTVTWKQKQVAIGKQQYELGLIAKPLYLKEQIDLTANEESLVRTQLTTLTDLVSLYKALGGGW